MISKSSKFCELTSLEWSLVLVDIASRLHPSCFPCMMIDPRFVDKRLIGEVSSIVTFPGTHRQLVNVNLCIAGNS